MIQVVSPYTPPTQAHAQQCQQQIRHATNQAGDCSQIQQSSCQTATAALLPRDTASFSHCDPTCKHIGPECSNSKRALGGPPAKALHSGQDPIETAIMAAISSNHWLAIVALRQGSHGVRRPLPSQCSASAQHMFHTCTCKVARRHKHSRMQSEHFEAEPSTQVPPVWHHHEDDLQKVKPSGVGSKLPTNTTAGAPQKPLGRTTMHCQHAHCSTRHKHIAAHRPCTRQHPTQTPAHH